jgi:hypothetical protein
LLISTIVEIPADVAWQIEEYDGAEWVAENIEFGVEIASTVSLNAYILSMKHKVVIAAVPFIDSHRAMAAPAVLKASLKEHGY